MQSIFWLLVVTASAPTRAAEATLAASTDVSNEGYFVLNWDTQDVDSPVVLQQASSTDFDNTIDRSISATGAVTITGLADGDYFFRIISDNQSLTAPVQVSVQHHSLARAGSFFLLGFVLFSLLVFMILNGNRRTVS